MQYHNDREPGKHTNPDIDQSRTRLNREMCPHADYEGEIQARIDAGYKGTRRVRKDAVRLVEGIVTASPEFFEDASAEEVRDFFEDALGFCREEFGESNLVHFTVHMDEETPHAHFGFVPLRDGKLSWKGFFPDKAALGAMQDRFYGRVGALYGLSRGEKRLEGQPARRHKSVAEYKADSRRIAAVWGAGICLASVWHLSGKAYGTLDGGSLRHAPPGGEFHQFIVCVFLDSEGLLYLGQGAGSCLASVWQSVWHVFNHIGVSLPSP